MKRIISLTSYGYKILSIFLSSFLIGLTVGLIIFYQQVPWYAICFSVLVSCFCILATFICFNHCIVVDLKKDLLKVNVIKTKKIKISDILSIRIDTTNSVNDKKYCFIIIALSNGELYKTSEFATLRKNNAVKITKQKIDYLNKLIAKI